MSASKSIDSYAFYCSLLATYLTLAVFGCSSRETVDSTSKSASDISITSSIDSGESPKSDSHVVQNINSETPALEVLPSNPTEKIANTTNTVTAQTDAEQQLPPTDALALRREAKQLADELVRRFPNNPDSLEIKARFLMLFGETEEAKNCWLAATNIDTNYAYALQGLGKVAILNSDFDEAIEYLKKSIPRQPSNADPVHDLSDAYMKAGRPDDSIACLRAFADSNPQSALTFLLLGQSYLSKEQFEDAESAFRSVLQISPGQPRAENGLATVLVRLGKREEAKQLLANQKVGRKANEKNRSPEEVFQDELKELSLRFQTVAEFYAANGDQQKAEQVARRALVLNPNNIQPQAMLVEILHKQDRLKESLEFVNKLSVAEKDNPRWPYTRGALLSLLGDPVAARQAYEDVVKLAPTSPAGYESLARLVIGTRIDLQSAIVNAKKAVEVRGSAADYELLAQAHAVNSDFASAHASLSEAIRREPANQAYIDAMNQLEKAMKKPK